MKGKDSHILLGQSYSSKPSFQFLPQHLIIFNLKLLLLFRYHDQMTGKQKRALCQGSSSNGGSSLLFTGCRARLPCLAWSFLLDVRVILRDGDWKWTGGLWRPQILDDSLQPVLVVHKGWLKKIFIRKRREGGGKRGEREWWRNAGRAMRPSGLVNKDWVFFDHSLFMNNIRQALNQNEEIRLPNK